MNLATVIALICVIAAVFFAVRNIVKEKKKGTRCIGCPYAGTCEKAAAASGGCCSALEELEALEAEMREQLHKENTDECHE